MRIQTEVFVYFMGYSFKDVRSENLFVYSLDSMLSRSTMVYSADFEDWNYILRSTQNLIVFRHLKKEIVPHIRKRNQFQITILGCASVETDEI